MIAQRYLRTNPDVDDVVTVSADPEARLVLDALEHIDLARGPVLILGELGCGRGAIARRLHAAGRVDSGPMLEVDCCALDSLEMIRSAVRGTIFLREIQELSSELQEELQAELNDLVDRGGIGPRLVVSGSPGLAILSAAGAFSADLLRVLGSSSLHLPPLRDRSVDIPGLVGSMLERYSAEGDTPVSLAEAAMGYLLDYDWPGNIAELEQVVERLCAQAQGGFVSADQLPPQIRWFPRNRAGAGSRSKSEVGFNPLAEEFQFRLIADALRRTQRR